MSQNENSQIHFFFNFKGKAAQNSRDIHEKVVETFQVSPKRLTDRLTAGSRAKNDKVQAALSDKQIL